MDLGDLRFLKHDIHYTGSSLLFDTSKTGEPVPLDLLKVTCKRIESSRLAESLFLVNDFDTGTAFKTTQLQERFTEVRMAASRPGDPHMTMRTLRHSAVVDMGLKGLDPFSIASITRHSEVTIWQVLKRYAVDVKGMAMLTVRKRHVRGGGSESDSRAAASILCDDSIRPSR